MVRAQFAWTAGEAELIAYRPTALTTRYACSACGSYLLTEHQAEPDNVFVSLGTLDTSISAKPAYRQFTGAMPAWLGEFHDMPVHEGWPPDSPG